MTTLHRIAHLAHPRMGFAPLGSLQPKPRALRPLSRRAVALGPSGLRAGQATESDLADSPLGDRGLHHQGPQHLCRLTASVGVGPGHDHPQRHRAGIAR